MTEQCRHCGESRWEHVGIGGVLLCHTEFEAEPPTCWFCEEGWSTEKRDRRKTRQGDVCRLNEELCHIHPEDDA